MTRWPGWPHWVFSCHVWLCVSLRGDEPTLLREWPRTDGKPDTRKFRRRAVLRFYYFMDLRFCDFRFWSTNFTHSKQDKSMWRPDDQVDIIEFFLVLSCLDVSIDTWGRGDAVSRRTTNRRRNRPLESSEETRNDKNDKKWQEKARNDKKWHEMTRND